MSTLAWAFTVVGVLVGGLTLLSLLEWVGQRKLEEARRALDLQGKRRIGL